MTELNNEAQLSVNDDATAENTAEAHIEEVFSHSAAKMREKGMSETAINQFHRLYSVWQHEEASNWIREEDVEPLEQVPNFHDVYETINHDKAVDAFAKTAFLKLNGGLGTSMGLECAKSLLPVRRHKARQMRFIDIIIGQVLTARTRLNVELPLTFMNSFRTSADTMKVLKRNRNPDGNHPASGAKAGRRHRRARQLPGKPRSGMVPSGTRRPVLHYLGVRSARRARGARLQVSLHLQFR